MSYISIAIDQAVIIGFAWRFIAIVVIFVVPIIIPIIIISSIAIVVIVVVVIIVLTSGVVSSIVAIWIIGIGISDSCDGTGLLGV